MINFIFVREYRVLKIMEIKFCQSCRMPVKTYEQRIPKGVLGEME